MICDLYEERLGDYVDGTLPAADIPRLEAHLAGCSRCREVAADFRAIRSMARSLEPHLPPAHVWPRVSAATRTTSRRAPFGAFLFTWQPAAATAMAMTLSVGLWWVGSRLSSVTPPPSTSSGVNAVNRASAGHEGTPPGVPVDTKERRQGVPGDSAPLVAEVPYTSAIARLEALTGTERAALDPVMVDVLDTGLTVIDAAIDQSRAALETEPDSEIAQESLLQALRSKVALLQNTLTLVNEMRIDSPSGGGMASGMNR